MNIKPLRILAGTATFALLFAMGCGGGSSSSSQSQPASTGNVHVIASDDATEDWATIGVKVLSVSLVPQSGGSPVVVYTAPSPVPVINLLQLDQLGEIIGNATTVPVGTYTAAKLTLSANPGDVMLVTSADPEPGFDLGASYTVPAANIRIQGTTGTSGSLTVPLSLNLLQPLVVTANSTNALDLEFDLKHPAFIVEHYPASASAPLWAINFKGPVRHHLVKDLTRLLLRHTLGQVTAISTDDTTMTITKDFATYPVPAPGGTEAPIASNISLNILADSESANPTIFYDLDAGTKTPITSFSSVATTLPGKYVRVAARYQAGGTLVAVRIWASTSFQKVWVGPEGHVVHVNTATDVMSVNDENGNPIPISIGSNTQFYFRTPQTALADATPIGTGASFFDGTTPGGLPNLARGFKVHVSVIDPLAVPMVADTVDIEIARYDGAITAANPTNFDYTRTFTTALDGYSGTLPYIASTAANGTDASGNAITGFDWWYFTLPALADTSLNTVNGPVQDFVAATSYGNSVLKVWGVSYSNWGDGATNPSNWYARFAVLEPTQLPKGVVNTPWASINNGGSIVITPKAESSVTVDLSTVSGSATVVYEVTNNSGIVTVTQHDLTNPTDLATVEGALVAGTPVKVFGVPVASGAVGAYVVFYYDGNVLPQ
jgi:hypothetical protein